MSLSVIIPVYDGFDETVTCIKSVIDSLSLNLSDIEVIILNDKSPNVELTQWLVKLAAGHCFQLHHNQQNLGFVATVNLGMSLAGHRDVILLNSDTVVSGNWIDRIVACANSHANIGTITPFSNNATICSYPNFCKDNALAEDYSVLELDQIFAEVNKGEIVNLPTAVGFCMYIRRECLNKVGLFDVEAFGKGYGEENDFCVRAENAGWRNVLCADVFVYHAGNVSFGDEHNDRKAEAMAKLREMHPTYEKQVHRHILSDPSHKFRDRVTIARFLKLAKTAVLFVTHNRGGGTERHIQELQSVISDNVKVLILRSGVNGNDFATLEYDHQVLATLELHNDFNKLVLILELFKIQRIHYHHTIAFFSAVFDLPRKLVVPYDVTIHDYYTICPQINLIDITESYCKEPEELQCNQCLMLRPGPGKAGITAWRQNNHAFLSHAERCFVPSIDVLSRMQRYFSNLNYQVVYHDDAHITSSVNSIKITNIKVDRLRVLVFGAIPQMKGAGLLESAAIEAKKQNLPIDFKLIGYSHRDLKTEPISTLTVTGKYKETELSQLIDDYEPHLIWFPALWPETYSYTLTSALESGFPIVAANIGALRERLLGRDYAWVVPWDWKVNQFLSFFMSLKQTDLKLKDFTVKNDRSTQIKQNFIYKNDYCSFDPGSQQQEYADSVMEIEKLISLLDHNAKNFLLSRQYVRQLSNWLQTVPVMQKTIKLLPRPIQVLLKNRVNRL